LSVIALVYVIALLISLIFDGYPLLPLEIGGYSCLSVGLGSLAWLFFFVRALRERHVQEDTASQPPVRQWSKKTNSVALLANRPVLHRYP
jgi:hypothetical protein